MAGKQTPTTIRPWQRVIKCVIISWNGKELWPIVQTNMVTCGKNRTWKNDDLWYVDMWGMNNTPGEEVVRIRSLISDGLEFY